MKLRLFICAIAGSALLALPSFSLAGLLSVEVAFPDQPVNGSYHSADINYSDAKATVDLNEEFTTLLSDLVAVSGETDGDPDFVITKKVKNKTSQDWTGYSIEVSGEGVSIVDGSVSSEGFSSATYAGLFATYSDGTIHPGDYVTLHLTVNLADDAENYSFGLIQSIATTPVPEPSTIALGILGILGAFGSVVVRRR
jgi:hypothetical protein